MKTAVLTTIFNEEKNIEAVLAKISPDYDIFVVDDGSSDNTINILRHLGIHIISLPINIGQGAATIAGYNVILEKDYDIIVKLDGDGQHNPSEISHFVGAMREGDDDIVVGSRRLGSNYITAPFLRRTFLPAFAWLINVATGYRMTDPMCGFRAFRTKSLKKVIASLNNSIEPQYLASEMFVRCSRAGLSVGEIPINLLERSSGNSYKGEMRYGFGVLRALTKALLDKGKSPL
ncbi:glycosyltransferase family 2 protein [Thermodesulfobacteriota bacterium]